VQLKMTHAPVPRDLTDLRIGYVPASADFTHPADRRRFPAYASRRNLRIETADPTEYYDLVIVTLKADLTRWGRYTKANARVLFDMIDSYYAVPRTDIKGLLRGSAKFVTGEVSHLVPSYWSMLDAMCRRADAVVCTTEEQAQHARRFCDNVHVILDIHSDLVGQVKQNYAAGEVFNLVWEGLPQNIRFLEELSGALAYLSSKYKIALHVVTDLHYYEYMGRYWKRATWRRARKIFKDTYLYEWNPQLLSPILVACDLGLIPVPLSSPLEAGKPENKLLLFWRMAVPVVTSATRAYRRTMRQAGVEMCCHTLQDWKRTLEYYLLNEDARSGAGRRGKGFADTCYGEAAILARWDGVMASLFAEV